MSKSIDSIIAAALSFDDICRIIFLNVAGSQVVLLQALFDTTEDIGIVRTIDIKSSLIGIMTITSMLTECASLLTSIQDKVNWRLAEVPPKYLQNRFKGYFKKGL